MGGKARQIGPHSRPNVLAKLDGRTRSAALMRRVREELSRHVGSPSATQRQLIERAAWLSLHVALFDARALEAGGLGERDTRQYLAYSNALARTLKALGLKHSPAPPPPSGPFANAGRTVADLVGAP